MFNSIGGRNLLVGRAYGTGAMVGQGTTPMPGGYYRPGSEYNWYSYAGNDPMNARDISGYQSPEEAVVGSLQIAGGAILIPLGVMVTYGGFAPGPLAGWGVGVGPLTFSAGWGLMDLGLKSATGGRLEMPILPPNWPFSP